MGDSEGDDLEVIARYVNGATLAVTDHEIHRIGTTADGERGMCGGLWFRYPGGKDMPPLEIRVEARDGAPVCTEIRLVAGDSGQIRVKHLQMLAGSLENMVEDFSARAVFDRYGDQPWWGRGTPAYEDDREDAHRSARKSVQKARQSARSRLTPELLSSAADLYRSAQGNRLKAIQDGLGVSERTAARYVVKAREAGLLDG